MKGTPKKRFVKSSAALVSLGIHAVLVLVALSFVAVTVIQKDDQEFVAKPVNRPKMQLKKLQVPVNIKKKKMQKPRLRKRIVVQPKLNQTMPDIRMPEITGVKGGLGNAAGGLGGAGSLGFSMPEFEIFGIKGKGEKVFLILNSSESMMSDSMGGIPAYTIIKQELMRIVDELPPTALFNVAVYQGNDTRLLFPAMVSANDLNQQKLRAWLEPLNAVSKGMGARDYGVKTLGPGGEVRNDDVRVGPFVIDGEKKGDCGDWFRSAMLAAQMHADTVFLLTNGWGDHRYRVADADAAGWKGSAAEKRWNERYKQGLKLLEEENRKRAANGQPPRILKRNHGTIVGTYFPGTPGPPRGKFVHWTPQQFAEGFEVMRKLHASDAMPGKSGISQKRRQKDVFSFNVVQFVKADGDAGKAGPLFRQLTSLCDGDLSTVKGMDAVQSYVSASSVGELR